MTQQNTIEVEEVYEGESRATGARLHVSVSGAAFFLGDSAVEKAREVRELVDGCRGVGVEASDVSIVDVRLCVASGLFLKSSTATYRLSIRARELEAVPALLDVIAGAKNCTLSHIAWDYGDEDEHERRWLARAAGRAKKKAAALAEALGVTLGEVSACREVVPQREHPGYLEFGAQADLSKRKRSVASALPSQLFAPTRCHTVRVSLAYLVA